MKYRKLRIVWSVAWGTAAVLLIALWVRSYWWYDTFEADFPALPRHFLVDSTHGRIGIFTTTYLRGSPLWLWTHDPVIDWIIEPHQGRTFDIASDATSYGIFAPDWFAVLLFGSLAFAPWTRWRFSLRTLLLATTLVAVGLGY